MDYQIDKMIGDENTHRFVLASKCTKPIVVIGVNPSTANERKPDPTVRKVMGFAELGNYDGFVMLNLYAQRATKFNDVHHKRDEKLHQGNLDAIREYFRTHDELDVLAAWGNLIDKRNYLSSCLRDIVNVLRESNRRVRWMQIGELTKAGHPRHPLYACYDIDLENFDVDIYIDAHCSEKPY